MSETNAEKDESGLTQLLCCPFCGGEAHINYRDEAEYVGCCMTCFAEGSPSTDCERETAAKLWNRRTT